jgi:hypothetical protein
MAKKEPEQAPFRQKRRRRKRYKSQNHHNAADIDSVGCDFRARMIVFHPAPPIQPTWFTHR